MTPAQSRSGTKFICQLPEGYDERTKIAIHNGKIIVAHPNFLPCYIEDDKLVEIRL